MVSHLQYADDTLLIGEASIDNPWAMTAVLRTFELFSGLRVNLAKSSLIGVNVLNNFLSMGVGFLNYK